MNRFRYGRWLLLGAISLCILVALLRVIVEPMRIIGDCMEPAIRDGQWCFVNRFAYWHTPPDIDDVVLFRHEQKVWISRVVAVGGQRVEVTCDGLVLDGSVKMNDPIARAWSEWNKTGTYGVGSPCDVPAEHVYVLSDNLSARHDDGRVFGSIPAKDLLGRTFR